MKKTLRLILGDQLNSRHSWFSTQDENITYLLMEVRSETDYVTHHIQKVVSFFLGMRLFSEDLRELGHNVIYFKLDDKANQQRFAENINYLIGFHNFERFEYQLPDEYRLDEELKVLCQQLKVESQVFDTEHFYTQRLEMKKFFDNKCIIFIMF